jgi:hypothetical protein
MTDTPQDPQPEPQPEPEPGPSPEPDDATAAPCDPDDELAPEGVVGDLLDGEEDAAS